MDPSTRSAPRSLQSLDCRPVSRGIPYIAGDQIAVCPIHGKGSEWMSEEDAPAIETELVDLSGIKLTDLGRLRRPVLERCIRRLLQEADDTWRPIAGFDAHI